MLKALAFLTLAGLVYGQTPAAQPAEVKDPFGRTTPQSAILQFLEACHSRDYAKAAYFLDLRKMSPADRAKDGPELATQLEDLLDDTPFDIATLSRAPEGDQEDGLGSQFEHLDTFKVDGKSLEMQLERVELKPGLRVWLVSSGSVAMIPAAHGLVAETPFEKRLPQPLVTYEILHTPVWRWRAPLLLAAGAWVFSKLIGRPT